MTDEGLHLDIYRDGERYATEYVAPPMSGAIALDRAEDHFQQNLEQEVSRMALDHGPVTDEEFAEAREELRNLRADVRQALAEELGGDPEDYRADRRVSDRRE